jgi:hypothetical protein
VVITCASSVRLYSQRSVLANRRRVAFTCSPKPSSYPPLPKPHLRRCCRRLRIDRKPYELGSTPGNCHAPQTGSCNGVCLTGCPLAMSGIMALDSNKENQQQQILPTDIPPRTSSHQQHTFQDASGNAISPSSPPRRRSSKRPISGTVDAQSVTSYTTAQGKQPVGQSRPHSSYFPTSASAAQYTTAGALPGSKTHTRSRSRPMTTTHPLQMQPPSHISLKSLSDELQQPQKQASWSAEKEKILLGPFDYLYGHPGKDIRAQLIASFNAWLRVPKESLSIITKVVGMLHTASLLCVPPCLPT